ncbi:MAG TPA: ABC transporter permease [Bacteroidia bacterium]|nr:ABC transporter permease [Bacteroidia bacterium]HNT80813.1 ABC transporter permease [Bacteroidia bacterium]
MRDLFKVFSLSFKDLIRSRIILIYFLFFSAASFSLLFFSGSVDKAVISLMNIVIFIVPLIASVYGSVNYYNSLEFTEMLLAQPIKRSSIFLGQLFALALAMIISFSLGIVLGFLIRDGFIGLQSPYLKSLLISGAALSLIFSGISFLISLKNTDKAKGISYTFLIWLVLAILYDGFLLIWFIVFEDYPIEKHALVLSLLNPVDICRIDLMLEVDSSAMMGYTGAVFKSFFGNSLGQLITSSALILWIIIPYAAIVRTCKKIDF